MGVMIKLYAGASIYVLKYKRFVIKSSAPFKIGNGAH